VFFTASAAVRKATGQRPWLNLDASLDAFYLRQPEAMADRGELNQVAMKIESGTPLSNDVLQLGLPVPGSETVPIKQSIATPTIAPPVDSSLMRQADTFLYEGDYGLAIEAFSVLINDANLSKEQQLKVRRSRGVAYLGRRQDQDIERAILDYQACGEDGVHMSILAESVSLKIGNESKAKARKNQIALVTLSQGDWLWIESVQDNQSIQGWVTKDAFVKPAPKVASEPIMSAKTSQTPAQAVPVWSSFPQSSPKVQSNSIPTSTSQFSQQPQQISQQPMSAQSQFRTATPQSSNQFSSNGRFQQSNQSVQRNQFSDSGNNRSSVPSGGSSFTQKYMQKNNRPPSIWETPQWESPAEIRRLRAQGLVR